MRIFTLLLVLVVLFIGISFAVLNANSVPIHYYFSDTNMPLSLLLVIALIVGVLIGLFTALFMFFKSKAKQRQLRKQLEIAQKEINNLRKIPIEEK